MATAQSVYSKALFLTARQNDRVGSIKKELKDFQLVCTSNSTLKKVLNSPLFGTESRTKLIKELAKKMELSGLLINFLELLSRNRRFSILEEIISSYESLINLEEGVEDAVVRSAVPLSTEQIDSLSQALATKTGKKVNISQEQDRDLLGGFVVTVAGRTFDTSLRKQLQRMESICKI